MLKIKFDECDLVAGQLEANLHPKDQGEAG